MTREFEIAFVAIRNYTIIAENIKEAERLAQEELESDLSDMGLDPKFHDMFQYDKQQSGEIKPSN